MIVRIRRVLRMLLGYDHELLENIENTSTAEIYNFFHKFLDNSILANQDRVGMFLF